MQVRRALDRADGAQARERRPLASSPGGGRHRGPRGPRRRRPQPSGWFSSRRVPLKAGWRATAERWPVLGAPVSDRHRAGARNPHRQRRPRPISRLRTHASPTAQNRADMERRSPTGIARERETRPDNAAPRQSHGCEPTHRQPRRITGTWSAGLRPASRGSAKPAPTTPPPANLTAANPRIANRAESRRRLGALASSPGAPVSDRHRAGARNPRL